jgi:signal peptidase I
MCSPKTQEVIKYSKLSKLSLNIFIGIFWFLVFFIIIRIFIYDIYSVNTSSMYPAIIPGDKIIINKISFGIRILNPLKIIRLKGLREITYNDIVVFNNGYRTTFNINKVLVKRCIALPGDTISISNGIYHNSSIEDSIIKYSSAYHISKFDIVPKLLDSYPFGTNIHWTILDFGPLYVPRKGDLLSLSINNIVIYARYIKYETGKEIVIKNDSLFLNNKSICSYRFKENYYFIAGDNFKNSQDSRYFGLVPESFIIGIATKVLYSIDPYTKKLNLNRIFKDI